MVKELSERPKRLVEEPKKFNLKDFIRNEVEPQAELCEVTFSFCVDRFKNENHSLEKIAERTIKIFYYILKQIKFQKVYLI